MNGNYVKRDENGRFVPGTTGGPGRPKRASALRNAMLESVTEDDILEVTASLMRAAKAGEAWAVREFLDRIVGKPKASLTSEADEPERFIHEVVYTVSKDEGLPDPRLETTDANRGGR